MIPSSARCSRIRHPNVAEIMDLGEENDTLFLVMEWVDGDSLARLYNSITKSGQRFPLNVLLRIAADCCAGLHAAHELGDERGQSLGVVHRDVSPQNILVGTSGVSKVIDFGVAKAAGRLTQETSAGLVKGKIQYASPEQAMGRALDRRSDVWAMGTVLYQVLAGRLPYDGENQLATLHLLTSGKPPKPLPPTVPAPLQAIVRKALAFNPDERFLTARDMQMALETCASPAPTPADVAAVMTHFLGDRADARKREVADALAAVSSRQQYQPEAAPGPRSGRVATGMGGPLGHTPNGTPYGHRGALPSLGSAPGAHAPVSNSGVVSIPGAPGMPMQAMATPAPTAPGTNPRGGIGGKHIAVGAVALLITAGVWTGVGVVAMRGKAEAATRDSAAAVAAAGQAASAAAAATTAAPAEPTAAPAATTAAPAATTAPPAENTAAPAATETAPAATQAPTADAKVDLPKQPDPPTTATTIAAKPPATAKAGGPPAGGTIPKKKVNKNVGKDGF
jgi:eukaryotic-like serine/threonine-protein kinase